MANVETFNITATINAKDGNPSNRPFVKNISFLFVGTEVEYNSGFQVPSGSPTSITLPVSIVNVLYIKNLSVASNITVVWTPNSGSSATIQVLLPKSFVMFGQAASGIAGSGQGITALSVQSSSGLGTIEYVLG